MVCTFSTFCLFVRFCFLVVVFSSGEHLTFSDFSKIAAKKYSSARYAFGMIPIRIRSGRVIVSLSLGLAARAGRTMTSQVPCLTPLETKVGGR